MIIVRTPYRVSFFGGGTDYEAWYSQHGGEVLTCTLNKYCYISIRKMQPFLGSKYRIFWSKMETVDEIKDIEHAGVRGCLEYMKFEEGIEINHAGDLPARSGLGSSSAFTVGMLNGLHQLKNERVTATLLAKEAIEVEQVVLKETVGIQDQIECAFGGFNHIKIEKSGDYKVVQLDAPKKLEDNLMLFYTGIQRYSSEIAKDQVANVRRKYRHLYGIAALVPVALEALKQEDFNEFGELLHQSWTWKRDLSDKITNPTIDEIYDRGRKAGALGGKLLGAGGGGFMLFYVPVEYQPSIRSALRELIEVPFRFGSIGSQVMVWN